MGFLTGVCAATFAAAAIFFLRFWRQTADRLFAILSLGFGILALNYACLGILEPGDESRQYYFVIRLIAFLCIIAGVVDKNRRG
jgi:uncharacterized membrane protein YoaK (UPF0700 family)